MDIPRFKLMFHDGKDGFESWFDIDTKNPFLELRISVPEEIHPYYQGKSAEHTIKMLDFRRQYFEKSVTKISNHLISQIEKREGFTDDVMSKLRRDIMAYKLFSIRGENL